MSGNVKYKDSIGFFSDDKKQYFLLRCFKCEPERGRENYSMAVASGQCAWCGYNPHDEVKNEKV